VARLLTGNTGAGWDEGLAWVRQLVGDLHIPGLAAYGIKQDNLAGVVARAAQASSMKANPIVLAPDELAGVLESALSGMA
jgi:alcohol dehydrogenase class IV